MSVIASVLGPIAARAGADLVGKVLGERFGPVGGQLAEAVIGEIATQAGVSMAGLADLPPADIERAITSVEADMPELIALWSRGLDGQFALLQAEQKQGFWPSAWRWGWMYLLGLMWFVRLMVVPVADAITGASIADGMDQAVMMTLTGWFLGLYMGGHTLKELSRSGIEAVRALRGGK